MFSMMDFADGINKVGGTINPRDNFMLLKDCDGWSDGIIADIKGKGTNEMFEKAKVKHEKSPFFRFITDKNMAPKIAPVLDKSKELEDHEVESMSYDFINGFVTLKNTTVTATVNPTFLKYFYKTYKEEGISKITVTDSQSPVKVYAKDELVGVIMPIRMR